MESSYKIKGVSLVSLLVGLAIGTFIIVVMLQLFSSTKSNYRLSQNIDEMNNVLRYASISMTDIVGQAGFRTPSASNGVLPAYTSAFPAFTGTLTGPSGSTYDPNVANGDDPAGVVLSYFPGQSVIISSIADDKLWVKFQGNEKGRIRGCNDLYGVDDTAIRSRFYSRQFTRSGSSVTGYYCEDQNNNVNYTYSASTQSGTELIPPELFDGAWVRYGEDLTNKGYIDRWSLGADVSDRNKVYAVRVAFLIHSRDDLRAEDATQTFKIFGDTVTKTSKKLYKLHTFTILLPNSPNYRLASLLVTP